MPYLNKSVDLKYYYSSFLKPSFLLWPVKSCSTCLGREVISHILSTLCGIFIRSKRCIFHVIYLLICILLCTFEIIHLNDRSLLLSPIIICKDGLCPINLFTSFKWIVHFILKFMDTNFCV